MSLPKLSLYGVYDPSKVPRPSGVYDPRLYVSVTSLPKLSGVPLQELLDKLAADPDDRTIFFIVDQTGNNGKTWFAHWYASKNENCQVMCPRKRADMAYIVRTDIRVLILDAPRSKQGEFI